MSHEKLAVFRQRLSQGLTDALRAEIEEVVLARREETTGHREWGLLCEEAGLPGLAFRELQLALRDDPEDTAAAFRLAVHYRERGDSARAGRLLDRLLGTDPGREEWVALYAAVLREEGALPRAREVVERAIRAGLPPAKAPTPGQGAEEGEGPAPEHAEPTEADLARLHGLFAGRENVHARQWAQLGGKTGYSPVHEPLTPAVLRCHLRGAYTVGAYLIRLDGTCTFLALDLDVERWALEQAHARPELARRLRDDLRREGPRLVRVLRDLGLEPLLEDSGYKGRHLWLFLEQPEPAEVLHQMGRLLLACEGPLLPHGLHLEFFPRQGERRGKGLGNLIKLPLGIHRRTGRRCALLDADGRPLPRPFEALRQVRRCSRETLYQAIEKLKARAVVGRARTPSPAGEGTDTAGPAPAGQGPGEQGPPPPEAPPAWTEADFQTDPRIRHVLERCPVLAELKRQVEEHRRLSHEEQLVLIHSLGHVESGPQAVNYLLARCVDVGPEKLLKSTLRGHPVSCPTIRRKIGHVTRRVPCSCSFEQAGDRYPTPVLHLLTLRQDLPAPAAPDTGLETLARRYAAMDRRRRDLEREHGELRQALVGALRLAPERSVVCPGGCYRLVEREGIEELVWVADEPAGPGEGTRGD